MNDSLKATETPLATSQDLLGALELGNPMTSVDFDTTNAQIHVILADGAKLTMAFSDASIVIANFHGHNVTAGARP